MVQLVGNVLLAAVLKRQKKIPDQSSASYRLIYDLYISCY